VVAPNLGVVAETVRKTASGLVFRPADGGDAGQKILKLVRDQRTRESLSQNSLNASRLFDFERELEALTGLYQRVLKSPGTVHPSYMGTRGRR
jgi:glycosyltransferase involved in cell wall biosynthesis